MNVTILTALITSAATLTVCLINNHYQMRITMKQTEKKHNETINLIDYKLSELSKRVDKHNNVIERTYKLEELTAVQEEKIRVANHRIEDLERLKG